METATPYEPYGIKLSKDEVEKIHSIAIPPITLKPNKQTLNLIEGLQGISAYETIGGNPRHTKGKRAESIFYDDYSVMIDGCITDRDSFEQRQKLEEEFKYAGNARSKLVEIGMQEYEQAKKKSRLKAEQALHERQIKIDGLTLTTLGTSDLQPNLTLANSEAKEYRLRKDDIKEVTDNGEYMIIKMK